MREGLLVAPVSGSRVLKFGPGRLTEQSTNKWEVSQRAVGCVGESEGPTPRTDEIRENLKKFVAGSRRHIDADEWTWVPFWCPTSLVKSLKNFNWWATKTSTTTVQWKDQTLVGRPIKSVTPSEKALPIAPESSFQIIQINDILCDFYTMEYISIPEGTAV